MLAAFYSSNSAKFKVQVQIMQITSAKSKK